MSYAAKGEKVFLGQDPAHPDCTLPPPRRSDHRLKRFVSTNDKRAWHVCEEVRGRHFLDLMSGSQTCLDVDECHKYVPLEDLIRILMADKDELIRELQERLRQCCQEQASSPPGTARASEKEDLENQIAGLTEEVNKSRDMLRKAMHKLQNIDEIVNENKALQCRLRCSEERVKYLEEKKKHLETELADLRSKSQIQIDLEKAQQMLSMVTRQREETTEMDEAFLQCLALERDELQEKVTKLEKELEESKKREAEIEMLKKQSQSDSLDKEEMSRENECYRKKLASMKCLEKQIQELKKQGRALADKYKRDAQKAAEEMSKMGQAAKELQCLREERDSLRKRVNELASYQNQYNKLQKKLKRVDAVIAENENLNCKLLALQKLEKENEYLKCRLEAIQEMEMNAAEDKERIMQLQCAVADQEEEMKDLLCQIERLTSGRHEEELERLKCELYEKDSKLKLCEEQLAEIPMLEAEIDELRTKLQSCCREFPEKKRGENSYQKVEVRFPATSTGIKVKYKTPGEKSSSIIGIRREERVELKDKRSNCQEITQADSGRAYKVTSEFDEKKDVMSCDEVHSLLQSSKGIISCVLEDMIEHQKEMEELEVCNRSMKEEIESLKSKVGGADKDHLLEEISSLRRALEEKELEISRLRGVPGVPGVPGASGVATDGEDVETIKELNRQLKAEVAKLEKMLEKEQEARWEAERRLRGEGQSNVRSERQSNARSEGQSSQRSEEQSRPAESGGLAEDPEFDSYRVLQKETDDLKLQIEALNKLTEELKRENELLRELQKPCPDFSKELDEKCALENLLQLLQAELDAFKGQKLSDECEALRNELKRVMEQNCQLKALLDCYRQRLDLEKKSNELNQKKLGGEEGRGTEAPTPTDGSAPADRTADGPIAADGKTPGSGSVAEDRKTAGGSITADRKSPAGGSIPADRKSPAGGSITADRKSPAGGSIPADRKSPAGGSITADRKSPAGGSITADRKSPAGGSITADRKSPAGGSVTTDGKSPAGRSVTSDGKTAADQSTPKRKSEEKEKLGGTEARQSGVTSDPQESAGTRGPSQEAKEVGRPGPGTPGQDVSPGKTEGPATGEKSGCEEELKALKDNLLQLQNENENLKKSLKEAEQRLKKASVVSKPTEAEKESEQEKGKTKKDRPSEAGKTDAGAAESAAEDCLKELEKLRKEKADCLKELEQARKEKDDIAKQLDAARGSKDAPKGPETADAGSAAASDKEKEDCLKELEKLRKEKADCLKELEQARKEKDDIAKQLDAARVPEAAGKAGTTDAGSAAASDKEKEDCLKELERLRKERDDFANRLSEAAGGKPGATDEGPAAAAKAEKEKADCLKELEQLRKERDDLTKRLAEGGGGKPGATDGSPAAAAAAEKEKADCLKELEQLRKERDDLTKRLAEGGGGKPGATDGSPAATAADDKEKADCLKELEQLRKEKNDLATQLSEARAGGAPPGSQPDNEKADLLRQIEELKKEKRETPVGASGPGDLQDRIAQLEAENADKLRKLMEQHEKELANRDKIYNENLTAMKTGYETDIRKLTERHKQSIMRLQELHEDEVQEMNLNYETQMETLQTQSEAAINDVAKGSAAKARKLAEQHSKELKDAERKFHVALDEKESQYLEELGGLRTNLTRSRQELETLKKTTKQGEEGRVDKLKAQQEKEIEKVKRVSQQKVDAVKDQMEEEKRKFEAEIESLKQQLKDKGRGEGVCECKFSKRKPPKRRDPSCPLDFNEVLEKILEEGLDSLTFNEIALVHAKACCALEGIVMKSNAGSILELEPPVGDGCPHMPLLEADKQQLFARILDLENTILQRQRQTQDAIISMEVAIKKERCRLQEVRDLLQNEQRKNSELKLLLNSQTKLQTDLKKERDRLGNQAFVHRSLCQEKSKQLDEETKSRKCLEAEVEKLRGTLRQLCASLDPARRNSESKQADQIEAMRAQLEQSVHQERRLALQLENEAKCRMQLQCQLHALRQSIKHVVNLPEVESVNECSQNPFEAKSAKERQNMDQINEKRNKMKTKSAKKQKK